MSSSVVRIAVVNDGVLSRWALGTVLLVALAASQISAGTDGIVLALTISFITITFSAVCNLEKLSWPSIKVHDRRKKRTVRTFLDFLLLWLDLLTQLNASATCTRIASATMDYMSNGRTRLWLFGYESHSLGETWPDALGVTIIILVTIMFMLGLENSTSFYVLLNIGIISCLTFFVLVGSLHTTTQRHVGFWSNFLPSSWNEILTTAAMCSYGFIDVFPIIKSKYRCLKSIIYILLPVISYYGIAIIFTMMAHFRELSETTVIPMVRVFEARDVDWARPIMASFIIIIVSISLMEICPKMYDTIVILAEWRILAKSLAYKNETTGCAVLAIFTAGSLAAILAFACPFSYLVRLLNVTPLLAHMLEAMAIIYDRYQPESNEHDTFPVYSNVAYSCLPTTHQTNNSENGNGLKFNFLPAIVQFLHKTPEQIEKNEEEEERECLLMDEYLQPVERPESNLDLESSSTDGETSKQSDGDISTDVDAIVAEYKDKLNITENIINNKESKMRLPSRLSGRCVLIAIILILISSIIFGYGMLSEIRAIVLSSISVILLLATFIAFQPQKPRLYNEEEEDKSGTRIILMPWIPTFVIASNALLATTIMPDIWLGIVLWLAAGLILFCRCSCNCDNGTHGRIYERVHPSSASPLPPGSSSSKNTTKHINKILIDR